MRMLIKKLILILFLCSVSYAANDFSADANCCAFWGFEDGALTTDSIGTNTLSTGNSPVADTVNYKEGAASVDLEKDDTDYLYITDGDLDAGYPHKSGDTNKKISICFWIKFETIPASYASNIYYKGIGLNKNSFRIRALYSGGNVTFNLSIGIRAGLTCESVDHGTAISADVWYHVGMTHQDSDKYYKMRIWDDNASALLGGAEVTGNFTNSMNIENGDLYLSSTTSNYEFDGLIDEMVVFNDILSSAEIDQIRAGTYGATPPTGAGQVIIVEED